MKRWLTTQQMANDIAMIDKSNLKEFNISQCNMISKYIKQYYEKHGNFQIASQVVLSLPGYTVKNGFSMDQKERVEKIINKLFKWHWFPLSRIRNNMRRLCES